MARPLDYLIVTEFDDESLIQFVDDFMRIESDPKTQVIAIYISSYGGDTSVMSAMRDFIKSSSKIVATIAIGKAMSSGVFLLAAGTKGCRFASENTEIMVHEVASVGKGKASDVVQQALDLDRFNKKTFKNFASDIGKTAEEITEEMKARSNTDWYMSAQEAKKIGLIDRIGLPRIGETQSLNMLLVDPIKSTKRVRKSKGPKKA